MHAVQGRCQRHYRLHCIAALQYLVLHHPDARISAALKLTGELAGSAILGVFPHAAQCQLHYSAKAELCPFNKNQGNNYLVPSPEMQGSLGMLRSNKIVPAHQAQGIGGAGIIFESGQVCAGVNIPVQ